MTDPLDRPIGELGDLTIGDLGGPQIDETGGAPTLCVINLVYIPNPHGVGTMAVQWPPQLDTHTVRRMIMDALRVVLDA